MATTHDPEEHLSKWFLGSPVSDIKRENLKEWLRWAFLNTDQIDPQYEDELEGYIDRLEVALGRPIEPGRGKAKPIRLNFDEVNMLHRSLLWYVCIFVVDSIASTRLRYFGFRYHRAPLSKFCHVFPYRPHNVLARHTSPSKEITYWHQAHESKTELPILFLHGIGVGLYPYVDFLADINGKAGKNGRVGIIAVEMMPISSRLTGTVLPKDQMCEEIEKILDYHGWKKVVLVSHSYGSVVSTHLLKSERTSPRIGPVLFVDPVCVLLHLPDVAYNFVYRVPKTANEHQVYYFASRDMGVSHTLSRCFFWTENILWKEDIGDRDATVSLSALDSIIQADAVGAYLTGADDAEKVSGAWKHRPWKGQGLDLVWFGNLDHAQVFDRRETRALLVGIVKDYCSRV
ncbi:hypothetical protein ANO11243_035020 [Dothideomycetidae sp. 11243]|nr:hypothetical protein ANO11243_035020 [fungal sp. No.11243]